MMPNFLQKAPRTGDWRRGMSPHPHCLLIKAMSSAPFWDLLLLFWVQTMDSVVWDRVRWVLNLGYRLCLHVCWSNLLCFCDCFVLGLGWWGIVLLCYAVFSVYVKEGSFPLSPLWTLMFGWVLVLWIHMVCLLSSLRCTGCYLYYPVLNAQSFFFTLCMC